MKLKLRFERFSKNNILLSALMLGVGLILFLWPGQTLGIVSTLLGVALLVGGVVSLVSWYRDRHVVGAGYTSLAIALACLLAGLVVLLLPKGLLSLLPRTVGMLVLINGFLNLAQALELRRKGGAGWLSSLLMAVLTIVAGLFLVFHAFGVVKIAVMFIGGVFIYNGASNLWIEYKYRKAGKG